MHLASPASILFLGTLFQTATSTPTSFHHSPNNNKSHDYIDWRTFHGRGVNLGGWLQQESTIDTTWWSTYSGGTSDEWNLCAQLGSKCGPVLEHRYKTFITTRDIDTLASSGVTVLRIPTSYAAWVRVPGSQLYSGKQKEHIHRIATYAIEKYDMHIILDIHSLPGGTNGLDIGEAVGHWGWYNNDTALKYSLDAVDDALHFIQFSSGHPQSYTLSPINEPVDNRDFSMFGTPAALSEAGASWVLKYLHAVIDRTKKVNPRIPVMCQGSFKPETYWSPHFDAGANIVFDEHHYYFQYANSTSANLPEFLCKDAKKSAGDGKFPTFVGEWAIEASDNDLGLRGRNLQAGISAFGQFTRGSSYWTAKFSSNATIKGEGVKGNYWNYEEFVRMGYLDGQVEVPNYCQ
ncbi:hypothetical protein N7530_006038 [Penicillium desertorum]|uniref:glucan 1,3-beta-glucosidase n=1 Tax=Penicillium desertorum TaxID=1303715 RepID=A0A9X0BRY0_9EURO|nr:hypothetical protein N7530_006038 [Penicillium desertorum]